MRLLLNAIVKNEAARIPRMLESVRGLIDGWCILDTGSTDGTREIIRAELDGIPGRLVGVDYGSGPFPFATARNEALKLARDMRPERILFLDADETLELVGPRAWDTDSLAFAGDLACCHMLSQGGQTRGMDCLMIRGDLPGEFTPITHEAFKPAGEYREVFLPGVRIVSHDDSDRRGSGNKSRHDVELLTVWCAEHPDDHRAQYYLAQSLWNVAKELSDDVSLGGPLARALFAFERRILMGGHPEETWFSMYMRGACLEKLKATRPVIVDAYLTAYNADPTRNEPLCALWSYYFEHRETTADYTLMRMLAGEMLMKGEPDRGMYVDLKAYKWCPQFMYGLALLGLNRWGVAEKTLKDVFPLLPEDEKIIARQAIAICRDKVGG